MLETREVRVLSQVRWRRHALCGGKLFHTRGPAALKLQSPKLFRVRGTKHVLKAAERRGRRSESVTSRTSSASCVYTFHLL